MKNKEKQVIIENTVVDTTMEDVMHNSFMTYAEYVILERALPRAEDGLKPVQRRILYTLYTLGLTPDKPFKKSARIVGEALGKYHPHGDTSVYDAMVRLAQDFSMRYPLVDGHGNFGSLDGDPPAAMRYTEARMSKLALEMLRDINKDTVAFTPNFDDSEMEPVLLPSRFPNLLVNGSSGIAVGLATNIPPHNLSEVIGAVMHRLDYPNCHLDSVMKHIQGPDFPTGGVIIDDDELRSAYETGKGKILIRAKASVEKTKNGKSLIVINEVPYEIKKSALLQKIYDVTQQKKNIFGCIDDIRDESDREGIRAVIEIKKGFDPAKILSLLYKYTDLQSTFGINLMVIADGAPVQASLLDLLDYYINHQKKVVTRRTEFDLERAEKREHILEGLIIAVADIDMIVKIIRGSSDAREARLNLMKKYHFTGVQAQAILDMRLARLTSLEIVSLKEEYEEVKRLIARYHEILGSEAVLISVIKEELNDIKKKYGDKRRTVFVGQEHIQEVDEQEFKVVEECAVLLSGSSNLRRVNVKSLQKSIEGGVESKYQPGRIIYSKTDSKISVFTSKGNIYTLPVDSVYEGKLKDNGKAMASIIQGVDSVERIINLFDFSSGFDGKLLFATKSGMLKYTDLSEYNIKKSKILACGLKDGDEIVYVDKASEFSNILLVTKLGMAINFDASSIPTMGRAGKGVSCIKLAEGDEVIYVAQNDPNSGNLFVLTNKGSAKRTPISEYGIQGRNGKGTRTFAFNDENGSELVSAYLVDKPTLLSVSMKNGELNDLNTDDVSISSRNSKGETVVLALMGNDVTGSQIKVFVE